MQAVVARREVMEKAVWAQSGEHGDSLEAEEAQFEDAVALHDTEAEQELEHQRETGRRRLYLPCCLAVQG